MRGSWQIRLAANRLIPFIGVVMTRILGLLIMLFLAAVSVAAAQGANQTSDEKCDGAVYQPQEVSQKARIISKAIPTYTEAARMHNINGRVALTAVLCRSGHVTDIQVVKGLSYGLTEGAIAAAKQVKFEPAQKDGQTVSQAIDLEYGFSLNPHGHRPLAKEPVEGRVVESRMIMGMACNYRREVWRQ